MFTSLRPEPSIKQTEASIWAGMEGCIIVQTGLRTLSYVYIIPEINGWASLRSVIAENSFEYEWEKEKSCLEIFRRNGW